MRYLLLVLALLLPLSAQAQPLAPKLLPLGRKVTLEDSGTLKCFTLLEWNRALSLDDELWRARKVLNAKQAMLDIRAEETRELKGINSSLEDDLRLARKEIVTMTLKWEADNKALHLAEADRDWWKSAAFMVTFAAGAAVVTYVAITYREDIFQN